MSDYNLFTLKKNDSGQLHLFRSKKNLKGDYNSENQSICNKMEFKKGSEFLGKSEQFARTKCAELGRAVCGTCVSNLYADY